jgi:hypothetical protein
MFVNIFVATIAAQVLTTLIAIHISPLKVAQSACNHHRLSHVVELAYFRLQNIALYS